MFVGHYGLALAARRAVPRTSLPVLFFAAQLPDLLWPLLLLAGVERVRVEPGATAVTPLVFESYPWSHSLLVLAVAGLILACIFLWTQRGVGAAVATGLMPVGHWVLDAVTHAPDLPLVPWSGGTVGWGLWNHPFASFAVEAVIFGAGLVAYTRGTRPRGAFGRQMLLWFAVFLTAAWITSFFGPPPPDATPVIVSSLAQWLFLLVAVLLERNRESVRGEQLR